ncbi:hypothetical protein [Opitutus terrae]|uniref:Uncharacterized protein n=1 Tax=Opitutus terrae (strain DSM 11246 / JCM 15787 / PB90-1) TaxID=452637 RepID=B1ZSU6_OPITP|nr:hypothetical protein [Opitutus terrae]ACB74790.1 hypothetical protein Oter_1506 [Opitutus terrae PB90-1]
MKAPTPDAVAARVLVRAINFELDEPVRRATADKAVLLVRRHPLIEEICIELENDPTREAPHEYVAKGRIDFGGPALLSSVTGGDATGTLNYLLEQLEHQLRKQRLRPAPAPDLPSTMLR